MNGPHWPRAVRFEPPPLPEPPSPEECASLSAAELVELIEAEEESLVEIELMRETAAIALLWELQQRLARMQREETDDDPEDLVA